MTSIHDTLHGAAEPDDITEADRSAMRAYLQRTEVRHSTLHRIAVAFVNGAGLLLLFPVFFREEINVLLGIFLSGVFAPPPYITPDESAAYALLFVALLYPFVLSVSIPLYALYLLLKDVIHFYFSIYTPGFSKDLFTPSFSMGGVTFSPDESETVKRRVMHYQFHPTAIDFLMPFSAEKREQYFDETMRNTDGEIIPRSRRWERLEAQGYIPDGADRQTVERFNAAFGLARTRDRRLVEEVAAQEVALVRSVLYLRRLVLRYMKALLMFIWTTIISFVMLPFAREPRLPTFVILALGYLVWAVGVVPIMRLPLAWIYRHKKGIPNKRHIDRQLNTLVERVAGFCYAAVASAALALVVSVALLWG